MALDVGWRATTEYEPAYPSAAVKAAVHVLLGVGGGPLHYRDLSDRAISLGLWEPRGATPWHTLNADVRSDIDRAQAAGGRSVFVRGAGGLVSLASSQVTTASASRNQDLVKRELLDLALTLHPRAFELLAAELLRRMGYNDVRVTRYSGDGGVDVTATHSCGPLASQRFVFQVKRVRGRLGQRFVRELRGVLGEHDQGVLISTGAFHPSAWRLAAGWARPVVLVDGDRLADLFIEHRLGVRRVRTDVLEVVGFPRPA